VSNEDELNATDEFWIERRAGGSSDSETWSEDDLNEGEPK
jgi:hypothetical protein